MSNFVFEKAKQMLDKEEIPSKKYSKGFKIWLVCTVLLMIISLCIIMNDDVVKYLYDESLKYEITSWVSDKWIGFITPVQDMCNVWNGLYKVQLTDLKKTIQCQKEVIGFILLMINLTNITIGSIIFEKD